MRAYEFIIENVEHFNGLDFSIEIEKDDEYVDYDDTDNQTIYVRAFANGRELGHVLFTIDYDGQGMILKPQDLEVEERYQGQGIARTMYDYVKSKGYSIRRSGQQTDAGAGFWNKHRPEQNIWEAFDQPYPHEIEQKSEFGDYDTLVRLPDGNYLSIMFNHEGNDEWQVEFYRNNSQEVTGEGDAQRIFATVLNAIQKFIKEHKPWRLIFSAKKDVDPGQNSESRAKLYSRLVKRYAAAWGYDDYSEDHGDQVVYELTRLKRSVAEGKKRRRRNKYFGGYWYPGYGYYGSGAHGGESSDSGGDGSGGESVTEAKTSKVLFIGNDTAIVGQEHGKRLQLSDSDAERVQAIAQRHGAWYEGNGMDRKLTQGIIDDYEGSWDDDLLSPAIKGYPAPFLYVLFSNIKENDTVEGKIGSDPESTIFDRIIDTQPSTNYFPDRKFDAETLQKFLQAVSEGPYDFVQMSQAPATESNVRRFFTMGEQLMWPDNWEQYPNRAGRVAKSVNDLRDRFLASRKQGVYVAGSDHLQAVKQFLDQTVNENFADGKIKGKSRPGRVKRAGASCNGSVTDLRQRAKNASGEKAKMYHWCANMKSGRSKK
jgi:GNAT superfamily N-acetyltransferase/phage gp37-like protein